MKLFSFYLCLPAIVFQAIFASSSLDREGASLTSKKSDVSKVKKVSKLARRKKLASAKELQAAETGKDYKSKDVMLKENSKSGLLIEVLPKELVQLVADYLEEDNYSVLVSTRSWSFKEAPKIAVDATRLYVLTELEGLKGLSHSLSSSGDERHCVELGDPQWARYDWFSSSYDGRQIFFGHSMKSTFGKLDDKEGSKWLTQSNELEDGGFKRVKFDGESSNAGILSRDGQTLFSYSRVVNPVTQVYQIREKDLDGLMKSELNDVIARAVSGKGNRVMATKQWDKYEIHNVGKDTSNLVCRISTTDFAYICALNEDGSEAAFVLYERANELHIMDVDKVVGDKDDQPAIVKINVPELGKINKLAYDDGNRLHVLHDGGSISFFDSLTKKFILLEIPQEGREIVCSAISPDTNYIALLQKGDREKNGKTNYETIVKRKRDNTYWMHLFGCKVDKRRNVAKS